MPYETKRELNMNDATIIREQLKKIAPTIYKTFLAPLSDEELIQEIIRQKKARCRHQPATGDN
jgi:hypothetical protein